jgi:hypothetical protein
MKEEIKEHMFHKKGSLFALPAMILASAWVTVTRGLFYEGLYFTVGVYFLSLLWTSWTSRY